MSSSYFNSERDPRLKNKSQHYNIANFITDRPYGDKWQFIPKNRVEANNNKQAVVVTTTTTSEAASTTTTTTTQQNIKNGGDHNNNTCVQHQDIVVKQIKETHGMYLLFLCHQQTNNRKKRNGLLFVFCLFVCLLFGCLLDF